MTGTIQPSTFRHLKTPAIHKYYNSTKCSCTTGHTWVLPKHAITSMHRELKIYNIGVPKTDTHFKRCYLCIICIHFLAPYCVCVCVYIYIIQNDQKVSVHLMITIQKVTSNVQSVIMNDLHIPQDYGCCLRQDRRCLFRTCL
jgi:hypothetical protein